MALTVAKLGEGELPELIQASYSLNLSGVNTMAINEAGKLVEIYQLLFSLTSGGPYAYLAQPGSVHYLHLELGSTNVIFADMSNAPLILSEIGVDPYVYNAGVSGQSRITLWYRLIDAP